MTRLAAPMERSSSDGPVRSLSDDDSLVAEMVKVSELSSLKLSQSTFRLLKDDPPPPPPNNHQMRKSDVCNRPDACRRNFWNLCVSHLVLCGAKQLQLQSHRNGS